MNFSPLLCYLVPLRSKYFPKHRILERPQPTRLHSSFNVSDQVSHPYKPAGKIIVPYILVFIFLGSIQEDKVFFTE